ncbi:MAG: radical SAM family heme chaperone HemW [Myxococcaceae bacterium]
MPPPEAPIDPLTGLSAARFGVYIHFPYCLSKCPYCDFASTAAKQVPEARYARAIRTELERRQEAHPPAQSVFLGGGTPSLWSPQYVGEVLDAVAREVGITEGAEVTLEANPGASDATRFQGFRAAGVNRLSIGVQSFQPGMLKALGREHNPDDAEAAFRAARRAGFENVSLDFIYGVQGQTLEMAQADARRAVALEPNHLSAYALTLDRESLAEEVPLAKQLARGEVVLPADDETSAQGEAVREVYAKAGLERYETSNCAQPGYHSRHNSLYWTGGEYLALGVGATGFLGTRRYSNHRSAEKYLDAVENGRPVEANVEMLTRGELFEERLAMGLRLSTGVDLAAVCERFDEPFEKRFEVANTLVRDGFATWHQENLVLTSRGAELHSAICARML